jgi:hypothetical protein
MATKPGYRGALKTASFMPRSAHPTGSELRQRTTRHLLAGGLAPALFVAVLPGGTSPLPALDTVSGSQLDLASGVPNRWEQDR